MEELGRSVFDIATAVEMSCCGRTGFLSSSVARRFLGAVLSDRWDSLEMFSGTKHGACDLSDRDWPLCTPRKLVLLATT